MKATIERAALLKSLGHVQSVVERRNTIPILSNVLIEASDDGRIKLMATDLDLQVVETVEAQVETAGSITVSAPYFVRHCPQAARWFTGADGCRRWQNESQCRARAL